MRQIYTSPRVENVDRVVALLGEAGIQTSVTNRRSYAGHDYKRPSYATPSERDSWPQVWIVKAEDQPKARALSSSSAIATRKLWAMLPLSPAPGGMRKPQMLRKNMRTKRPTLLLAWRPTRIMPWP